jgi:hypothetical protein
VALNFPNTSRVYDEAKRCIRFWGHDASFEISFQVDDEALQRISPHQQQDEDSLLRVFDTNRARIERVAQTAYSRRRRQNYHLLPASDF